MLSLFTRHINLVAARTARTAIPCTVARRTLIATPRLNFPSPKASERTEKTAENKPRKSKAPPKRGRPPKSPAERRAKQPKQEKQRVRIPKNLKPPKRGPGPYVLFYSSFLKSQPQAGTLPEYQELSKRAGEIWRGYSMVEKQPFYDESEARKAQANQDREEFFRNTSLSDLKQLNAIRKAQGKTKFHSKRKTSIPPTPFILFSNEFRSSTEGQAIINDMSPERRYTVRAVVAAADRWRSMSAEEKAPYFEKYRKAKEELKAESAES